MKKTFINKLVSVLMIITMLFPVMTISASATDKKESDTRTYEIEVHGEVYTVIISDNADGTKNISVDNNGEILTWSTYKPDVSEEETSHMNRSRRTASYSSYRYIYNSEAASIWNLYRPLQPNGSPWAKGVSYDSVYCNCFADAVDSMNDAEDRINQYLADENLANSFGMQLILSGAGGLVGFAVAQNAIASMVASIAAYIIDEFVIPYVWTTIITALVDIEYNNIRDYIADANYYFDLA